MSDLLYFLGELPMAMIFAVLGLGIFISLRILNVPDLATEGSFGLGVVVGSTAGLGLAPVLSLPAALLAGAAAGLLTGFLQTKIRMQPTLSAVLSGIVTLNVCYSVNLVVMHRASRAFSGTLSTNFSLQKNTIFRRLCEAVGVTQSSTAGTLLCLGLLLVLTAALIGALVWFFGTNTGLAIRATGDNPDMVRASSINVNRMKLTGLCLSNALVALSGALLAQYQNQADFGASTGTLIRGLAAVIVGGALLGRSRGIPGGLLSACVGALVYDLLVAAVVRYHVFGEASSDLKSLTIAALMAAVLLLPGFVADARARRLRKEAPHA